MRLIVINLNNKVYKKINLHMGCQRSRIGTELTPTSWKNFKISLYETLHYTVPAMECLAFIRVHNVRKIRCTVEI